MADRLPSPLRMLVHRVGYQNRVFRGVFPIAAFFTLAFPLMFLLLFASMFGDVGISGGREVAAAQFYAPGLAVFTAGFSHLHQHRHLDGPSLETRGSSGGFGAPHSPLGVPRRVVGSGVCIAVFGGGPHVGVGMASSGLTLTGPGPGPARRGGLRRRHGVVLPCSAPALGAMAPSRAELAGASPGHDPPHGLCV
ncbi:MAG: hypothetical protein Ct9H300mP12_02240 [Acidimicrobiales bacterium]|nr:MAG: hypothetical protein Ct9H300mP12_02240 [Acidimicrobiales bacterium]